MKLCILTEYFNPGGAGGTPSALPALARELLYQCPDLLIDVVTSRNVYRGTGERLPAHEQWGGVQVFRLPTPCSNQRSTGMRLAAGTAFSLAAAARLATLSQYDLLLVGTNPPMAPIAGVLQRSLRRTPYVYLIHDLFPDVAVALGTLPAGHPAVRLASRLQRDWLSGAARVVVIGRCMRDHLMRAYDVPHERIDVIPNWADPDEIRPLSRETAFRRAYGLTGFVVLYAGNLGQYQDFDTLLDTARRLQPDHPDIRIVLVGDGARKVDLARRIQAEKLANVRMFPFVPKADLPDLLASADVALVTLEPGTEGLGVPSKLYTILAAGRPVIAAVAPTSEVALVLGEEACGLRVDQGDVAGMTAAILRLTHSPATVADMGMNAHRAFENRFTLASAAARFLCSLHSALGKDAGIPSQA